MKFSLDCCTPEQEHFGKLYRSSVRWKLAEMAQGRRPILAQFGVELPLTEDGGESQIQPPFGAGLLPKLGQSS